VVTIVLSADYRLTGSLLDSGITYLRMTFGSFHMACPVISVITNFNLMVLRVCSFKIPISVWGGRVGGLAVSNFLVPTLRIGDCAKLYGEVLQFSFVPHLAKSSTHCVKRLYS